MSGPFDHTFTNFATSFQNGNATQRLFMIWGVGMIGSALYGSMMTNIYDGSRVDSMSSITTVAVKSFLWPVLLGKKLYQKAISY